MTFSDEILTHVSILRRYSLKLTRNAHDAEDLVQDTIIRALTNEHLFMRGSNLRAWLLTIMRNYFLAGVRKRKNRTMVGDDALANEISSLSDAEMTVELKEVLGAFAELSPELQRAIMLVGPLGYEYEEAARMTNVAVGTIKSRTHRGRSKLAQLIQTGVIHTGTRTAREPLFTSTCVLPPTRSRIEHHRVRTTTVRPEVTSRVIRGITIRTTRLRRSP